jgi:cytochrome P450
MYLTRYADVVTMLNNPAFEVPPVPHVSQVPPESPDASTATVPPGGAVAGGPDMAWLRATVSRFASGPTHGRRRALATALLDEIDPTTLREHAAAATRAALAAGASPQAIAGHVPVAILAAALGLDAEVVGDVAIAAQGYQPGTDAGPRGDLAVEALVAACGGAPDENTAARIALLVQACDATAGLIAKALAAGPRAPECTTADALITETLRFDPPVQAMRRACVAPTAVGAAAVDDGTLVIVDVPAANRDPAVFTDPDAFDPGRPDAERHLTFGTGIRPCPGRDHAVALAAGVISVLVRTAPAADDTVAEDDAVPAIGQKAAA